MKFRNLAAIFAAVFVLAGCQGGFNVGPTDGGQLGYYRSPPPPMVIGNNPAYGGPLPGYEGRHRHRVPLTPWELDLLRRRSQEMLPPRADGTERPWQNYDYIPNPCPNGGELKKKIIDQRIGKIHWLCG